MKLLYDTSTQLFKPYTNRLGEEIVGLDSIYRVYELTQSDPPSAVPEGHHLESTEVIDHEARTVTRGWTVVENLPLPAPPPTMRSFCLACGRQLWSSIEAAVAAIPDEDAKWEAQQYLLKSPHVERNHPLVASLAAALELSSEDVDTVFANAKLIDETP